MFIAVAVVPVRYKLDLFAGAEKLFDLLNRAQPCFVHVDHHPCDDQPTYQLVSDLSLQAHFWVEIQVSFRLTPH